MKGNGEYDKHTYIHPYNYTYIYIYDGEIIIHVKLRREIYPIPQEIHIGRQFEVIVRSFTIK